MEDVYTRLDPVYCNWPMFRFVKAGVGLESPQPLLPTCKVCNVGGSSGQLRVDYYLLNETSATAVFTPLCMPGTTDTFFTLWDRRFSKELNNVCVARSIAATKYFRRWTVLSSSIEPVPINGIYNQTNPSPYWRLRINARCSGVDFCLWAGRKTTGAHGGGVYTFDSSLATFPIGGSLPRPVYVTIDPFPNPPTLYP